MGHIYYIISFILFTHCACVETRKENLHSNSSSNIYSEDNTVSIVESELPTEKESVERAVLSFYEWYLKAINTPYGSVCFPEVVEGNDGKCRLSFDKYFEELRKLGTVSEKFMKGEQERLSLCADSIQTVLYSDYLAADAYEYDQICPEFYYYALIWSQEPYVLVKIVNTHLNSNEAYVDAAFYVGDIQQEVVNPSVRIHLEKENGNWIIVRIESLHQ